MDFKCFLIRIILKKRLILGNVTFNTFTHRRVKIIFSRYKEYMVARSLYLKRNRQFVSYAVHTFQCSLALANIRHPYDYEFTKVLNHSQRNFWKFLNCKITPHELEKNTALRSYWRKTAFWWSRDQCYDEWERFYL